MNDVEAGRLQKEATMSNNSDVTGIISAKPPATVFGSWEIRTASHHWACWFTRSTKLSTPTTTPGSTRPLKCRRYSFFSSTKGFQKRCLTFGGLDNSDDDFREQNELVTKHIEEKKALLQSNWYLETNMDKALNHCFNFIRNTKTSWQTAQHLERIRYQRAIFPERLKFDGKKFGTPKLAPIYEANQVFLNSRDGLVAHSGLGTGL